LAAEVDAAAALPCSFPVDLSGIGGAEPLASTTSWIRGSVASFRLPEPAMPQRSRRRIGAWAEDRDRRLQ
jgi:hypothetical protein